MNGCYMNYCFFNECLSSVPEEIKKDMNINNSLIFNFSNFIFVSRFSYVYNPFLKDKYQIHDELKTNFNPFFFAASSNLHQKNDYKRLLFMYGLIATKTLYEYLDPKLSVIQKEGHTLEEIYNALDRYMGVKNKIDITKINLYKEFPQAYEYYDYVEDLIHYPLLRAYSFMGSKGYYQKSYKRFKWYCKYSSRGIWKKPFYIVWDFMFARHKQGKRYFLYETKKVSDSSIGFGMYQDALYEIWNVALTEATDRIKVFTEYLFKDNENKFRKKFSVPEAYKM